MFNVDINELDNGKVNWKMLKYEEENKLSSYQIDQYIGILKAKVAPADWAK